MIKIRNFKTNEIKDLDQLLDEWETSIPPDWVFSQLNIDLSLSDTEKYFELNKFCYDNTVTILFMSNQETIEGCFCEPPADAVAWDEQSGVWLSEDDLRMTDLSNVVMVNYA